MESAYIAIVVFHGLGVAFVYGYFLLQQNIYTQKIQFLNDALNGTKKIEEYEFEAFLRFDKLTRSGESKFPPKLENKYFKNPNYKSAINDFDKAIEQWAINWKRLAISLSVTLSISALIGIII